MKKSVIVSLSIATILVLASVIYGAVFFCIKIDVTGKINEIFAEAEVAELYDKNTGKYISIDADSAMKVILDEIKDIKFTNAIKNKNKNSSSTYLRVGKINKKSITLYDGAISLNNSNWYRAHGKDNLTKDILEKLNELLIE